jgi:threonine/homoserine/homoserine lactone efflux protein
VLTFILILLLVAAAFGLLGAVLKIALVLVLSLVLAIAVLVWAGWWALRSRMRRLEREWQLKAEQDRRRQRAVDIRHVRNEADDDPPELGRRRL